MDLEMRTSLYAALLCLFLTTGSHALDITPDALTISHGKYTDTFLKREAYLSNNRISLRWDWDKDWLDSPSLKLGGYFDLGYSQWKSHLSKSAPQTSEGADKAWAVSFSPVFRLEYQSAGLINPFLDLGGGVSYQSEKDLQKKRPTALNMGGYTQFEARAMIGARINTSKPFEASFGLLHYSNAGFHSINEALDFYMFNLTWVF